MTQIPPRSFVSELSGEHLSIGTLLKSMSVNMAEALSYTNVSFLFLDRQHGSPVYTRIEDIVRVADLNDVPVAVRVPRDDTSMITTLLDVGVRGIVLPQVTSTEYVQDASTHVRYADGRSLGSTTRAARFGAFDKQEYIEYVNSELALIPMIESVEGVRNAQEIAALEETTALLVGPGDLAHSLKTEFWSEDHLEAIYDVFDAADDNDRPAGIFLSTQSQIDEVRDKMDFVIYYKDIGIVRDQLQTLIENNRL